MPSSPVRSSIAITARVLRDWSADPAPATILVEDGRIVAVAGGEGGARPATPPAAQNDPPPPSAPPRPRGPPPPFPPHARLAALFRDLAAQARSDAGPVAILLGPNAPQRCSPALLALWRTLRDELGLGVHTHLLETRPQAMASRAR